MRTSSAVATVLSLVLSSAGAAAPLDEIVLSIRASGAVLVPVRVNGQGPFIFLLDTGASHTTIGSDVVDRLTLLPVAKVRVLTPAGVHERLVVRLEHMAIGNASIEGLTPSVVSPVQLHEMVSGIDGVIGQDFLSAFDYTVDYRRKRLRWTAEHGDTNVRLPLIRAGDRSLVQLAGYGGGAPVLMVPDSGCDGFVLFERDSATAVRVDEMRESRGVATLASQQLGRGVRLRELRVGAVTLRDQPAVILPGLGSRVEEGDGLMPLHLFSSVSFSNSGAYLVVRR